MLLQMNIIKTYSLLTIMGMNLLFLSKHAMIFLEKDLHA